MDKVHNLDRKPWILNKKLNIKDLLEQRYEQLIAYYCHDQQTLAAEYIKQLDKQLDRFVEENEQAVKRCFMFSLTDERALIQDDGCKLKMFNIQYEHAKRMISDRAYKVNYMYSLKMARNELLMRHLALCDRKDTGYDQIIEQEHAQDVTVRSSRESSNAVVAILVIQLWPQPNKNEKVPLQGEILFRSDQHLSDLRDQIKCQRDYGVPMDLSDDPEQQIDRVYRCELFKSAFFLVQNTFYNDFRDVNNIDLSAPIINWSLTEVNVLDETGRNTKVSRGIGPFKQARMEQAKFEDLQFRLGCPYLYVHQGSCEHLFTISDIRYVPNNHDLRATRFPFITATSIGRKEDNLRCYMCRQRPPHWYTRQNARLPIDPFFFCECCFYSFNYDENKKKIGSFQAFLYASAFVAPNTISKFD